MIISKKLLARAELKGSEEEFYQWLRQCSSCLYPKYSEHIESGEGRCVVAHVRLDGGGGVGYKPPYCAVPLTQEQHANQHQYGYEYYMPFKDWKHLVVQYLKLWIEGKPPIKESKGNKVKFVLYSFAQLKNAVLPYIELWNFKRPLIIDVYPKPDTRTIKQNNAQWLLYKQISKQLNNDELAKQSFLEHTTKHIINKVYDKDLSKMLHEVFKIIFNKKTTTKNRKHNDGLGDSFEEYIHDIIHYMYKFGVQVNPPSMEFINYDDSTD